MRKTTVKDLLRSIPDYLLKDWFGSVDFNFIEQQVLNTYKPELKHVSEIVHDEAAKEAFYKFSAELAIAEGREMQSKSDFYEAVFSKESLEDLHDVIRLVDCLRKLGYGV